VPLGPGGKHQRDEIVAKHFSRLPQGDKRWGLPLILGAAGDMGGQRAASQLGTLGSGNHFIEVCLDEAQAVWVMLHSGSRGTGNIIGRQFIEAAKTVMQRYFISLPDDDLAYLPQGTQDFNDYVSAVQWCQDYAMENRRVMMEAVLAALERIVKPFHLTTEAVNCHHNYVERENHFGENVWVTRKGAIRAREGDMGIIPGSMGQRSYIVRGKGNPESYSSCAHGAGRRMGRKEAVRRFTVDDLKAQTAGVECRKDAAVLDEIPSAYKDIDVVMENQRDLVEVVHTLKQVLCVKGA
jgi:tRNA-splicing ligase RtcB